LQINAETEHLVSRGVWGGSVNKAIPVGNRLYVSSGRRLVILDQTNEHNFVELGSIDLKAAVLDFAISGNYAYVCTAAQSAQGEDSVLSAGPVSDPFVVVNISNPVLPQRVWSTGGVRMSNWWSLAGFRSYLLEPCSTRIDGIRDR